jgi:hypothetical protein
MTLARHTRCGKWGVKPDVEGYYRAEFCRLPFVRLEVGKRLVDNAYGGRHVKRIIGLAGAVGVAAVGIMLSANGVAAAAPDLTGAIYGDAKQKLTDEGLTPVVRTRVGDKVPDDKCVIASMQQAPAAGSKTVYVSLNCYADVASPNAPGYSAQSPQGRAAIEARQQAQAQQQAESEAGVTSQNER